LHNRQPSKEEIQLYQAFVVKVKIRSSDELQQNATYCRYIGESGVPSIVKQQDASYNYCKTNNYRSNTCAKTIASLALVYGIVFAELVQV
jgi:hypothetical protein